MLRLLLVSPGRRVDLCPQDELIDPPLSLLLHVSFPDDDHTLLDVLGFLAIVQEKFLEKVTRNACADSKTLIL